LITDYKVQDSCFVMGRNVFQTMPAWHWNSLWYAVGHGDCYRPKYKQKHRQARWICFRLKERFV